MDYDIERAKELIAQREEIDGELAALFANGSKPSTRKPQRCSKCGEEGHSARSCTKQTELPGT